MSKRFFIPLLLALCLFSLARTPLPAAGDAGIVGVRITKTEEVGLKRFSMEPDVYIDYGSFIWAVLPRSELASLGIPDADYQVIENPYTLTLGGLSFDPLISTPTPEPDWEHQTPGSVPDLNLVQFLGPTRADWLADLEAGGLEVLQYIHPFSYVVWGEPASLQNITEQHPFVRWTGSYQTPYAIQPQHRTLSSAPIQAHAMVHPKADLAGILNTIESLGGSQISMSSGLDPVFSLLDFTLPGDELPTIAGLPGVYSVQPVPTDGGDRGELSNQINAGYHTSDNLAFPGYLDWLNGLGLSGEGVIIANVDSGIDQNHPDLINRMIACTGATCGGDILGDHGTHTAGIMAGDGSSGVQDANGFLRGLGMAPGANLVEQVYGSTYTQEGGMLILMTQSQLNGAVISGNSWGSASTPRGYDLNTRLVDLGVRDANPDLPGNQPLSYILSIMNGYGGVSSQGTPDEAKNIFSVGSTFMQYSNGSQYLKINDLSPNTAHGPALDGRNIPHMVAPGYSVDSTKKNSTYGLLGGTSMASPHVTGAAALFYEQYRHQFGVDPSPALVKAAFLPVAHDLAGYRDADGAVLGHPFDSKQGWGRLNAAEVLSPVGEVFYYDQPVIFENSGETWSVDITTVVGPQSLRAMLVWTDAAGHGLGGNTPAWVNDLDLSLSCNGQTYLGNNFGADGYATPGGAPDPMNNTEGIFLRLMEPSACTLTVTAANIAGDGVPNIGNQTDQDFALVVYLTHTNHPPTFTSEPVTHATQTVPYTYHITTYDPDGDTLTITAPTIPAWLTLTDHGDGSATLTGTPDETQMGYYSIELLVTDSFGLTEPQFFKIKVSNNQGFYSYFFSLFFHQEP